MQYTYRWQGSVGKERLVVDGPVNWGRLSHGVGRLRASPNRLCPDGDRGWRLAARPARLPTRRLRHSLRHSRM